MMFIETTRDTTWKETPTTYLACTQDWAIGPELTAHFAGRWTPR